MDSVLCEAGIDKAAGTTWATATTCALLHCIPFQWVMANANWSGQTTRLRHYMHILPEETLRAVEER